MSPAPLKKWPIAVAIFLERLKRKSDAKDLENGEAAIPTLNPSHQGSLSVQRLL